MSGEKKGLYRNLLESINDILPRIPLVTVMLDVRCDSEDVHLRSEMRCEEMVTELYFWCFTQKHPPTHANSLADFKSDHSLTQGQTHKKKTFKFNVNVTAR